MKRQRLLPVNWPLSLSFLLWVACGTAPSVPEDGGIPDAGNTDAGTPDAGNTDAGHNEPRCSSTAVACRDESIQQLKLFDVVSDAGVVEEGVAAGEFTTHIDARAGGLTPTTSYTYGRFTSSGYEKVSLSDEAAFDSLDWDLAVRRYVVRINSGVSGPSCVAAARLPPGTSFDSVTEVPTGLSWRTEEYFSATCDYVPDTSGIGAPGTALSSFWQYSSCVQMTGNVFVLQLRDGRYVKLQVASYYDPPAQAECNDAGTTPIPSGAGNVRIRWAFVRAPPSLRFSPWCACSPPARQASFSRRRQSSHRRCDRTPRGTPRLRRASTRPR